MSRVDHWADVRDRSLALRVRPPDGVAPDLTSEVEQLRKQVAEQQTKIAALCSALNAFGKCSDPEIARKLAMSVATKHGISFADLTSHKRDASLVRARHEAMWRLRQNTRLSYPQIGKILGDRDHSTIIHGIRRHEQRMKEGAA
jgi:chromosomal replication initiation ATPase DnaA